LTAGPGRSGHLRDIVVAARADMVKTIDWRVGHRRTVASHRYRSYPKLDIAGRHQRRDLITNASR